MDRLHRALRVLWNHFKQGFLKQRLVLKAGALSYTSVLCLLPLLAITFSVSSIVLAQMGPHQTDRLIDGVLIKLVPQIALLNQETRITTPGGLPTRVEIRHKIKNFLEEIGAGEVGVLGVGFLIFLSISLLVTMEHTFNDIWNIQEGRPWFNRVILYWSAMTLGLMFFLMGIALTSRLQSTQLAETLTHIPYLTRVVQFLTPFVLFWAGLTLFYITIPNTSVEIVPALFGGLMGGTLLQLNITLNTIYVVNVLIAGELYGWFGILPILLVGLYVFWLFVLSGAQLTYSLQSLSRSASSRPRPVQTPGAETT